MAFYKAGPSSPAAQRPATTPRKPIITLNPLPHSDGSASFAFGHQKSLASLVGPTEVRIRDELTDRATLDISILPLDGVPGIAANSFGNGTLQRAFASVIILERYPRSLLQLTVQTSNQEGLDSREYDRSTSGGISSSHNSVRSIRPKRPHPDAALGVAERAAHINAAMLALIHAGIACRATVCAVAVAQLPRRSLKRDESSSQDEEAMQEDDDHHAHSTVVNVVDPSPQEEMQATSLHLFAFACSGTVVRCDVGDVEGKESPKADTGEARLVLVESNGPVSLPLVSARLRFLRSGIRSRQHIKGHSKMFILTSHILPSSGVGRSTCNLFVSPDKSPRRWLWQPSVRRSKLSFLARSNEPFGTNVQYKFDTKRSPQDPGHAKRTV